MKTISIIVQLCTWNYKILVRELNQYHNSLHDHTSSFEFYFFFLSIMFIVIRATNNDKIREETKNKRKRMRTHILTMSIST